MTGRKQFDVEAALDAAMIQFWRAGHTDTSIDDLSRVTGLNRSSIYSAFGDKDALFTLCLQRYVTRYGDEYDTALSCAVDHPLGAMRAFFEVTLERIGDPELPDGCLVCHTVMATPVLNQDIAQRAHAALGLQRNRLRATLAAAGLPDHTAETFALYLAATNQSLAVMSRAGASGEQLRAVVEVALDAVACTLRVNGEARWRTVSNSTTGNVAH